MKKYLFAVIFVVIIWLLYLFQWAIKSNIIDNTILQKVDTLERNMDNSKYDFLLFYKIDSLSVFFDSTSLSEYDKFMVCAAIYHNAGRYHLDPLIIVSIIMVESEINPRAISGSGARGLMQLMPSTAIMMADQQGISLRGVNDLYNPVLNIDLGSRYLYHLLCQYKDLETALRFYNAGNNFRLPYAQYYAYIVLNKYKQLLRVYKKR